MYTATAYPEERDKGRWRGVQWVSNITGSAVGAAVALGISWNSTREGVPHSVYIVFIVLQCLCKHRPPPLVLRAKIVT
jgi:hypothetical protein